MAETKKKCPNCGGEVGEYRNPIPTVDIIIEVGDEGIILVKRKNYPHGWAIPGGFVDYGESAESAATREAREETSVKVTSLRQFRVYSDPARDPRQHTLSVVFIARGEGTPRAGDDAADLGVYTKNTLPKPLAFDHEKILHEYFAVKEERG